MISLTRAFVLCAVICIVMFAHSSNGQEYSSKYDDINIDEILTNSRLRKQYVNCVLNVTPCVTGAARFLKENFAEAFITGCKKCTATQVQFFDKIANWFTTNEPDTWNRAVKLAIEEIRSKNLRH